jgi:hypothetical protein
MEELTQSFLNHVNRKNHLKILLPEKPLIACIHYGESTCCISFSKDLVRNLCNNEWPEDIDIEITLPHLVFRQLLSRQARLSTCLQNREARFRGTFRNFLLVESLLWLGSGEKYTA